jgi:hypothetical protein
MPSRILRIEAAIMGHNLTETNYGNAYGMWQDLYRVVGVPIWQDFKPQRQC